MKINGLSDSSEDSILQQIMGGLTHSGYHDYFSSMSSKQMERVFKLDLNSIAKELRTLSPEQKEVFALIVADYFEAYLAEKMEKEINNAFQKVLK